MGTLVKPCGHCSAPSSQSGRGAYVRWTLQHSNDSEAPAQLGRQQTRRLPPQLYELAPRTPPPRPQSCGAPHSPPAVAHGI
jgi:hypothetical protein